MKIQHWITGCVVLGVFLVACIYCWSSTGYGKVSSDAYGVAQALYGSCLARSDDRLDMLDTLLAGASDEQSLQITQQEKKWLGLMIQKARNGDWKSAASEARRMMENQVEY